MADVLDNIFTDQAVRRLQKHALNSPRAGFRYRVLSLGEDTRPFTPDPDVFGDGPFLEVRRRWNRWIAAGVSCGLLDQPHGAELRSRLTGIDDDGFRSALAECMVCWALTNELGLQMRPRPAGRDQRVLEFAATTFEGEVNFEVKSPRPYRSGRPGPSTEIANDALEKYWGAVSMGAALRSANRQFVRSQRNILIIALPDIGEAPAGSCTGRWPSALERALYGEAHSVDSSAGPTASGFFEGNFVRCLGGKPRFTRISAAIALEDSCGPGQLRAAVLHNPYSEKPVDSRIFGAWKQFGRGDGSMNVRRRESKLDDRVR
jgi:hypothetical protein